MKVKIKDYQIIKNAELEFNKGITAIVGSTNNGKSSIIRAIKGAINNQGGSFFINYDAEETQVEIETGSNNILWVKSKKPGKSKYVVNDTTLTKIGQTQLTEVADIINMPEIEVGNERFQINFWKQLEKPFLVDKTAYQLFDFISKSKEQEQVEQIKQETAEELNKHKQELNKFNILIDENNRVLADFSSRIKNNKNIMNIDIVKLEVLNSISKQLESDYNRYNIVSNNIIMQQNILKKYNYLIKILKNKLDKVADINAFLDKLTNNLTRYTEVTTNIAALTSKLQSLDESKVGSTLDTIEELNNKIKKLETLINAFSSNDTAISNNIKSINRLDVLIKQTEEDLNKFDNCPLCGSILHKEENCNE